MSGPKLTAWEIAENQRRAEERRQALLRELASSRRAVRDEVARARTHAAAGVVVPDAALIDSDVDEHDVVAIEAAIRRTHQHADEVRRSTNGALAAHVREAGLANLAAGVPVGEATSAAGVNRDAAARATAHMFTEQFGRELDAILSSLNADAADALPGLLGFVESTGRATRVDERVLLTQIGERVASFNRRELDVRRQVSRARDLLLALIGVAGEDAAELRRRLVAVVDARAPFPDGAEALVDEVVERQRSSEDRAYVADMLRESLVHLGYEVGSSFATDLLRGTPALVDRAGWSEHAVEIVLTATDKMVMSVVREGDPGRAGTDADRRRDEEVEVEFCSTVGPVLDDLATRGIDTEPVRSHPAGANPVRIVSSRTEARRSSAAHRAQEISE